MTFAVKTLEAAALLVAAWAAAGCSTYTVRAIPEFPAGSAAAHVEVAGLRIGAQPYGDFDSAEGVFNRSPMENGILPILLIVDNTSEVEVELTRARIELWTSGGRRLEPLDSVSASKAAADMAPPAFLWVFPTTDARAMAFDWAMKCVPDLQVCKRGHAVRRFLYYPVGRTFAEDQTEQCALFVSFEHADRSKRQSVRIPLAVTKRRQKPEPEETDEFDFDVR